MRMTRMTRMFTDFFGRFIREHPRHPRVMERLELATFHGNYQRTNFFTHYALRITHYALLSP